MLPWTAEDHGKDFGADALEPEREASMALITLFSSTVECTQCKKTNNNKGLKKRNQHWYCIDCFGRIDGAN